MDWARKGAVCMPLCHSVSLDIYIYYVVLSFISMHTYVLYIHAFVCMFVAPGYSTLNI